MALAVSLVGCSRGELALGGGGSPAPRDGGASQGRDAQAATGREPKPGRTPTAPGAFDGGPEPRPAPDASVGIDAGPPADSDAGGPPARDAAPLETGLDAEACDDGDPCTVDSVFEDELGGAPRCRHVPTVCDDDGIACTQDVCRTGLGCEHVPDADACPAESPCVAPRCDSAAGCLGEIVPDGTQCGFSYCGRTQRCLAGECVVTGSASDPACDAWFTPDGDGMLPWGVPACASDRGDGVFPGSLGVDGSYQVGGARLFPLSQGRLLYLRRWPSMSIRLFDGETWDPGERMAFPDGVTFSAPLTPVGVDGEDRLLVAWDFNRCVKVVRIDPFAVVAERYAQSMFGADPCADTQSPTDVRAKDLRVAPDGSLWAFTYDGLFRFAGGVWLEVPFDDRREAAQVPELVFDEAGLAWVFGTRDHFAWRRTDAGFAPVAVLDSLRSAGRQQPEIDDLRGSGVSAPTPRGSRFVAAGPSIVELSADGELLAEYPPAPTERVVAVMSDAYGRPLVATGIYNGLPDFVPYHRFDHGEWISLGYAESVVADDEFNIFLAMAGKVRRLVADGRWPVGPVTAQSLTGTSVHGDYDLTFGDDALQIDFAGPLFGAEPVEIELQRTTLAGGTVSTSPLQTLSGDAACTYWGLKAPFTLERRGERTFFTCEGGVLQAASRASLDRVSFEETSSPFWDSYGQMALARDAEGAVYAAFIADEDLGLHVGRIDPDGVVRDALSVPGVTMARSLNGDYVTTPMVDLEWTAQGMVVMWRSDPRRHAVLFDGQTWSEIASPPPGRAYVDGSGELWVSGERDAVQPSHWTGSEWQAVSGGPVAGGDPRSMVFDAAGNPIVVAREGAAFKVLRHRDGAWQGINGSAREGGVTSSSCNYAYTPRLAIEGDLLCLSWLENAAAPAEAFVRCTRLSQ